MLSLKFLSLAKRSYNLLFFRMIFLHFKFLVFFIFFALSPDLWNHFRIHSLDFYCGLSLISSKVLSSIWLVPLNLNLFVSKMALLFSNSLSLLVETLISFIEKFTNVLLLSFLFFDNFLNFFTLDLLSFSRLLNSPSYFRFCFQPLLFILFLYRAKNYLI